MPDVSPKAAPEDHDSTAAIAYLTLLATPGELSAGHRRHVADGYHRVGASYHTDENTDLPFRLVVRGVAATANLPV